MNKIDFDILEDNVLDSSSQKNSNFCNPEDSKTPLLKRRRMNPKDEKDVKSNNILSVVSDSKCNSMLNQIASEVQDETTSKKENTSLISMDSKCNKTKIKDSTILSYMKKKNTKEIDSSIESYNENDNEDKSSNSCESNLDSNKNSSQRQDNILENDDIGNLKAKRDKILERLRSNAKKQRSSKRKRRSSKLSKMKSLEEAKKDAITYATSQLEIVKNFQSTLMGKFKLGKNVTHDSISNLDLDLNLQSQSTESQTLIQNELNSQILTEEFSQKLYPIDINSQSQSVNIKVSDSKDSNIEKNDIVNNSENIIEKEIPPEILPNNEKVQINKDSKEDVSITDSSLNHKKYSQTNYLIEKYSNFNEEDFQDFNIEGDMQQLMFDTLFKCNDILDCMETMYETKEDILKTSNILNESIENLYTHIYNTPNCKERRFSNLSQFSEKRASLSSNYEKFFFNNSFHSLFNITPQKPHPYKNIFDKESSIEEIDELINGTKSNIQLHNNIEDDNSLFWNSQY